VRVVLSFFSETVSPLFSDSESSVILLSRDAFVHFSPFIIIVPSFFSEMLLPIFRFLTHFFHLLLSQRKRDRILLCALSAEVGFCGQEK
jgi:hypothetical protein